MTDVKLPEWMGTPGEVTLPHQIALELARRILRSEVAAGARLPTERELAEEFTTTRNVVREALQRLEAIGVVKVRRGSGAYVYPPPLNLGIELFDVLLMREDQSMDERFLRDALEFRGYAFRFMVQLAALRRTDAQLDCIRSLVAERATLEQDPEGLHEVGTRLFREISQATSNKVCELLFNTVERISGRLRAAVDLQASTFSETQDVLERLVDAFERRDPALAELVVVRYLQSINRQLGLENASAHPTHLPPLA